MIAKGDGFRYFIDGKEVLYKDLQTKLRLDMTVQIEGLNVYYSSPKKEIKTATQQIKEKQEKAYIDKLITLLCSNLKVNKKLREEWKKMPYKPSDFTLGKLCINSPQKENKTEKMNRLIEEELERQEYKQTEVELSGGLLGGEIKADWIDFIGNSMKRGKITQYKPSGTIGIEEITDIMTGKKENDGKTDYSEIDFDILDLMANRFNSNKHKYPHGNMLKPLEEKQLLFALLRHLKKMIQPVDNDPETFEEHLASILCNAQMVYQQRKLNKNLDIKK